jgi:hypothetical protein
MHLSEVVLLIRVTKTWTHLTFLKVMERKYWKKGGKEIRYDRTEGNEETVRDEDTERNHYQFSFKGYFTLVLIYFRCLINTDI